MNGPVATRLALLGTVLVALLALACGSAGQREDAQARLLAP